MRNVRRLGLMLIIGMVYLGINQGGMSYLNPGKIPKGASVVIVSFVFKDL